MIIRCPNEKCKVELEYDDMGFDFTKPVHAAVRGRFGTTQKIFKCDVCQETIVVEVVVRKAKSGESSIARQKTS